MTLYFHILFVYESYFSEILVDCGLGGGHNLVCEWVMMASRGVDDENDMEFGNWTPGRAWKPK